LHGHNWKVELEVAGDTLDKTGMLADFTLLKKKLHAVLETLDHKYLNEIAYFQKVNPTSENLTRFIYEKVKVEVKAKGIIVKAVTVWESENCCATYEE
jgi:6-pyruvoyltetrahydropterin/6-carboxytetrahydropterin synthase